MTNRALPERTFRLVEKHVGKCRHAGLILDRFAPWQPGWGSGTVPRWDLIVTTQGRRGPETAEGGAAKGVWIRETFRKPHADPGLIEAQRDRWREGIEALGGVVLEATLRSRLLVGLGASHVLETGLTLDRTSGAPIIPGSAVKGLTRTYALFEIAKGLGIKLEPPRENRKTSLQQLDERLSDSKTEAQSEIEETFRAIFGTTAAAGAVIFMSGVYAGDKAPQFVSDVMTPHFGDYYQGSRPPADNLDPNPIHFLAIERKQVFWFGLAPRYPDATGLLDKVYEWLVGGLTRLGAGGKTAAGYGYFSVR